VLALGQKMKRIIIICTLLVIGTMGCIGKQCTDCFLPAFEITMVNTIGQRINGFIIKAIRNGNDTLVAQEPSGLDTTYVINGGNGNYSLEITNPKYEFIKIDTMNVDIDRCGTNKTRILEIEAQEIVMSKTMITQYNILKNEIGTGCSD
jgi:hypothetical protein